MCGVWGTTLQYSRKTVLMKITPIENDIEMGVSTLPRSPGLHLSSIYGSLFEELEPQRFKQDGPPPPLKLEAGLTFEMLLEEGLARRMAGSERPGEFTTPEGVIYSPDLLLFNGVMRLGEIKLTWMSSREMPTEVATTLPPKFEKWLVQMRAYCYHLQTCHARLYAFFVNGNYQRPFEPDLRAWDIEFSPRELADNWRMLLTHAKQKGMLP